ncbi:MAG: fasciclin domain-containing protein, partial [Bacteroidota bacterium]
AVTDIDLLTQVLLLHVIEGQFSFEELLDEVELVSLQGSVLEFTANDAIGTVIVSDGESEAEILIKNVAANNGVVHVIDAVLLPN